MYVRVLVSRRGIKSSQATTASPVSFWIVFVCVAMALSDAMDEFVKAVDQPEKGPTFLKNVVELLARCEVRVD